MPNLATMSDAELLAWAQNFVAVANVNPVPYGATAAQVQALEGLADDLRGKVAARQTAEDAAKAATMAQNDSRSALVPDASYLNTIIKANKNVSDANKAALGIDVPKPRTKTAPTRPEDLTANGFEDGRNVLKWNRAGNKPNTVYIIEYKKGAAADFAYLATTTETKYTQVDAKPGEHCAYRVKAQRAGQESTWSNEAVVY